MDDKDGRCWQEGASRASIDFHSSFSALQCVFTSSLHNQPIWYCPIKYLAQSKGWGGKVSVKRFVRCRRLVQQGNRETQMAFRGFYMHREITALQWLKLTFSSFLFFKKQNNSILLQTPSVSHTQCNKHRERHAGGQLFLNILAHLNSIEVIQFSKLLFLFRVAGRWSRGFRIEFFPANLFFLYIYFKTTGRWSECWGLNWANP